MVYVVWVVGIINYIVTAASIARLSRSVWQDGRESALSLVLFPCSTYCAKVGNDDRTAVEHFKGNSEDDMVVYFIVTLVVWPLRVIWNALALSVILPLIVIRGSTRGLISLATRMAKRRDELRKSSHLGKRERIEQLLEERSRIDVEVETLESDLANEEGARVYRLPSKVK